VRRLLAALVLIAIGLGTMVSGLVVSALPAREGTEKRDSQRAELRSAKLSDGRDRVEHSFDPSQTVATGTLYYIYGGPNGVYRSDPALDGIAGKFENAVGLPDRQDWVGVDDTEEWSVCAGRHQRVL